MKRLILLLLSLFLTGCTALPAEERSFAVALGVSQTEKGWTVHARIPTYQTGGGYATVQGAGSTPEAALAALDAASPMQLHLGQLRLVVFAVDLARSDDFPAAMAALTDRTDLRMGAWVAVTETKIASLMEALEPATGARLSKFLDVLAQTRIAQGVAPSVTMADVALLGERQQAVMMNLTLQEDGFDLSGGWPVGADGRATQDLSAAEMQMLALMTGQSRQGTLTLDEGTVRLTEADAKTELIALDEASVRLTLHVTRSPLTGEALAGAVAEACLDVLNRLSAMGCDAIGLGRQAIMYAQDMAQWHELDWPTQYRNLVWRVSVGVE